MQILTLILKTDFKTRRALRGDPCVTSGRGPQSNVWAGQGGYHQQKWPFKSEVKILLFLPIYPCGIFPTAPALLECVSFEANCSTHGTVGVRFGLGTPWEHLPPTETRAAPLNSTRNPGVTAVKP